MQPRPAHAIVLMRVAAIFMWPSRNSWTLSHMNCYFDWVNHRAPCSHHKNLPWITNPWVTLVIDDIASARKIAIITVIVTSIVSVDVRARWSGESRRPVAVASALLVVLVGVTGSRRCVVVTISIWPMTARKICTRCYIVCSRPAAVTLTVNEVCAGWRIVVAATIICYFSSEYAVNVTILMRVLRFVAFDLMSTKKFILLQEETFLLGLTRKFLRYDL